VSFALYGPVKTWSRGTASTGTEMNVHLAGDKLLIYRQDTGRFSLYDLSFNEIALLKSTTDFSRIHYLALHRLGKNPEIYSGYGDGTSPRCPKPYGTCAAELERYTYGSSTTELLCPNENCDEGNAHEAFYDAKTGKMIINASNSGDKLYLLDPEAKTYTKWPARGAGWHTHFQTKAIIYDDSYIYVAIKKYPRNTGSFEIRRYRVDDFLSIFGTGNIEDYGEQVYYEATSAKHVSDRDILTYAPNRKTIPIYEYPTENYYEYDPDTNTFTTPRSYYYFKRYFGNYVIRGTNTAVEIHDLNTHTLVQTISYPSGQSLCAITACQQVDPIFVTLYDASNIYVYLLTYNNKAPVIQYDHVNRKIRVVDLITGNPLTATLWVWKSRFCYSRDAYPLNITPTTLSVSDWTPIPSAYKTECLTFVINSIA